MKWIKNIRAGHKMIIGYSLITMILLISMVFFLNPYINNKIDDLMKSRTKANLEVGYSVLNHFYEESQKGNLTEEDAKKLAMQTIKDMRYLDENYYWVNDYDAIIIVHPFFPELERVGNDSLSDTSISNLFKIFAKVVKEKNEDFVFYKWSKPNEKDRLHPKISYIKGFEPWKMIIGTGTYIDDLNEIKSNVNYTIIFSFIFVLVFVVITITYISKQRRNEQTLKINEAKYRRLTENSPAVIYQRKLNTDGTITYPYMSDSIYPIVGVSKELAKNNPSLLLDTIHPDYREEFYNKVLESAKSLKPFNYTFKVINGDRQPWIEVHSTPEKLNDGSILWDGLLLDVTERIETEEKLKNSELTYREIFNAVNDSIFIHDINTGIILDVNNSMLEKYGYSLEEVNENKVVSFSSGVYPYTPEIANKYLFKAAQGEVQVFEWQCKKKSGEVFWAEISLKRGKIAGKDCIIAIERDITERKKEQEELKKAKFAMDKASDGILWINNDGYIVYANDSSCKSLGYTNEEILDIKVFEIDPDFKIENWEEHKKQMFEKGNMTFESRHITKDGRIFYVEVSTNHFYLEEGFLSCAFDRDITKRKLAEEELKKAEERYRNVVETQSEMIARFLEDGTLTFANRAWNEYYKEQLGFDFNAIGQNVVDLMQIKDFNNIENIILTLQPGQSIQDIERSFTSIKGELRWQNWSLYRLENLQENKIELQVVGKDITESKLAEIAIKESEEQYRFLFESANDGIYIIKDGKYIKFNKKTLELFACEEKDILFNEPSFFSPKYQPDGSLSSEKAYQLMKKAEEGEPQYFYWLHTHLDGTPFDAEVSLNSFVHKDIILLQAIVRDITERKKTEEALKESEEKLRTLFSSMTETVTIQEIIFDDNNNPINYRILDCNDAFLKNFSLKKEDIVNKKMTDLYKESIHLNEFANVVLTGESTHLYSYIPFIDKHFSISVVSLGANKCSAIGSDITLIKKTQQLIAAKNKELEQIVYVASHDLRSPLVNVDGYSRELQYSIEDLRKILENNDVEAKLFELKRIMTDELPEMEKSLSHIRNSSRQMDTLLKGLLKLSRSGRAALNIIPVNMNNVLAQVISNFEYQIKKMGAEVITNDLPVCRGDAVQLSQVFSNLIGNALKYSNPERQCVISINGKIENERSVYSVEDNGIGIAKEHQEKIFELFHRLNPSQTDGEGLGLTIVKQIVSRLDGDIWIESEINKGSKFFVALPFAVLNE